MANLKDIVYYLVDNYPYKRVLFNARITKMVYLADWYSANVYNKQISDVSWIFNNYGPYVDDILKMAMDNPDIFSVKEVENNYGASKRLISTTATYEPDLTNDEKQSLDFVINITKQKTWGQFITFVYSTYPIVVSERYSSLDLIALAKEYQAMKIKEQA